MMAVDDDRLVEPELVALELEIDDEDDDDDAPDVVGMRAKRWKRLSADDAMLPLLRLV